ncbi:MAG TPA: SDR family oxidoreductase [Alphaproteobacteria bacterium]|nr:SDR family oxidoreductase [Alphaproteobacteria bacterium]
MDAFDLTGRVVIVTGGSRGLGKAMAWGLLAHGAKVALAGQDAGRIAQTAEEAAAQFGASNLLGQRCDVRERADCDALAQAALDAFGKIDVLVNNAALGQRYVGDSPNSKSTKFWEADPARWREAIDVNITGGFQMARAVAPTMIAQGWGRIVNVTTSLGTMQRKLNSPYGVTKAGMEAATLIWAQELDGSGVTVNTLIPGSAARTDMVFNARGPLLEPEVMVPPILWLASNLSDGFTGGRYVAKEWDASLAPTDAALKARELPVLREPPADRR